MPLPLAIAIGMVFAQMVLVGAVYLLLGKRRFAELRDRKISLADIALSGDAYAIDTQKVQNNLRNQFELPVLFFICVALAAATDTSNWGLAAGSVVFVTSRYIHAYIHTGSNHVIRRFKAFAVGGLALAIAWVSLAIGLIGRV